MTFGARSRELNGRENKNFDGMLFDMALSLTDYVILTSSRQLQGLISTI